MPDTVLRFFNEEISHHNHQNFGLDIHIPCQKYTDVFILSVLCRAKADNDQDP